VNEVVPNQLASGVKRIVPSALRLAVPFAGCVSTMADSVSPGSASVSLASTAMSTGVSSGVVTVSSIATGG
jgi:hypothetical protein